MVSKEMGGKLPVELGLWFPSTICSGDIHPGPGIEALSDLTVILHHVQQLEYQLFRPPGSISRQLLSYRQNTYLTEILLVWLSSASSTDSVLSVVLFTFVDPLFFLAKLQPIQIPLWSQCYRMSIV